MKKKKEKEKRSKRSARKEGRVAPLKSAGNKRAHVREKVSRGRHERRS